MELNFKKIGDTGEHLIILHGLFGSLDNWLTLGKYLSQDYQVWLVDQRNHGQSPHSEAFDYLVLAKDLNEFIETHQIKNPFVLGHSMGGKTVMHFATQYPKLVQKLIVVDIAPVSYPVHHEAILKAMNQVDFSKINRRGDVDEILAEGIEEASVRQFLLKNIYWKTKTELAWRFNLPVLTKTIEEISAGVRIEGAYDGETLFIAGGTSNYITEQYHSKIFEYFPKATIKTIAHAGHWVHAEAPEEFITIVKDFMEK
ncbi:alpha/beta fold hydrolase [bacterium]|nr:alpha/beta fold hydrolase [bacterium]